MLGGLDDQCLRRPDCDLTPRFRADVPLSRDKRRALVHGGAANEPLSINNVVLPQGAATVIEHAERDVVVAFTGL